MRYIYVDEAGTSANEPISVVAAIIAKPDGSWTAVRKEIAALIRTVPQQYQEGFIFHAKTLWGDKKLRDGWPQEERLGLIASFAAIPAKFGLSVAIGKVRRDYGGHDILKETGLDRHFTISEWHHSLAFMQCILKADAYMRERCEEGEIAALFAEDIPNMRKKLQAAFLAAEHLYVPLSTEEVSGTLHQGISQIKDGVQFVGKSQSPFLQIADACAFCFRRALSEQSYGKELLTATGFNLDYDAWTTPISGVLFTSDPVKRHLTNAIWSGLR